MDKRIPIKPEETLDDLILGDLKIIQAKQGYRFSIDSVLLAHFCSLDRVKQIVDLGTGSGIIPLLLTYLTDKAQITGVEIQSQMVERARRSINYNNLQDRVEIIEASINWVKDILPGGYADLIVCNPPFWKKGEGKLSRNEEVAIARHELEVTMSDIVKTSNYLLSDNGKLALIQRADRLTELINLFSANNISPVRIRMVHSKIDKEAKLVLIEGKKKSQATLKILPPLIIYDVNGKYSAEIKQWYQM